MKINLLKTPAKTFCFLVIIFFNPLVTAAEVPVIAAAASIKFALNDIAEAFQANPYLL